MDIVEELEKGCGCYADGSSAANFESHHCVRCRASAEITRLRLSNNRMREALEFYANPQTYVAIGFWPDSPCGDFMDDFSDDHGDETADGFRPGKRARSALTSQGDG